MVSRDYLLVMHQTGTDLDDEFSEDLDIENLGSLAFRLRKPQSVVATDRNYSKTNQDISRSYPHNCPDPFDPHEGMTLLVKLEEQQQNRRQLTPYEILVQQEDRPQMGEDLEE